MTFFRPFFLFLFSGMIFLGCNKNASTSLTPSALDSLKLVYNDINSQIERTWTEMIMDDDGKLENLRRILQEVTYSGNYNRLKLDSLNKEIDALAKLRYDQETMADSDLITLYDSLTTKVLGEVTVFTTSLPQFEQYPLMGRFLQEAYEADDRVLRFRIEYDRAAKQYNSFLMEQRENIQLIDNKPELQPKPLFELQE